MRKGHTGTPMVWVGISIEQLHTIDSDVTQEMQIIVAQQTRNTQED